MPTDLAVRMEDRPGALAALGTALGNAGINIDGFCGLTGGSQGEVHILVEDGAAARRALEDAGIAVEAEREPVLLGFDDQPGELGDVASKVASAGVNIDTVYVSCNRRLVLLTSDNTAALQAL